MRNLGLSSIDEALRNLRLTNQSREIFFHGGVNEVMVNGDAERIEQVIINLVLNAIKYSTGNMAINVTISREHDEVITNVQDQWGRYSCSRQRKGFRTVLSRRRDCCHFFRVRYRPLRGRRNYPTPWRKNLD